jgi:hypothetical protein
MPSVQTPHDARSPSVVFAANSAAFPNVPFCTGGLPTGCQKKTIAGDYSLAIYEYELTSHIAIIAITIFAIELALLLL